MKKKQRKIYYAHPMALYNTKQEERDIEMLLRLFPDCIVYNPNNAVIEEQAKTEGMPFFKKLVMACDIIAIRGTPTGRLTAGVAQELAWAEEVNMPMLELPSLADSRRMSINETYQYLKEVGAR